MFSYRLIREHKHNKSLSKKNELRALEEAIEMLPIDSIKTFYRGLGASPSRHKARLAKQGWEVVSCRYIAGNQLCTGEYEIKAIRR